MKSIHLATLATIVVPAVLLSHAYASADSAPVEYYTGNSYSDSYDNYYVVPSVNLFANGSTTPASSYTYSVYRGDTQFVPSFQSYFTWANGKYVWDSSTPPSSSVYPFLIVTGSHLEPYGGYTVYSVAVRSTPTPAPTPSPTTTPSSSGSGSATGSILDRRAYHWLNDYWPCDLSFSKLSLEAPSSGAEFLDKMGAKLQNRGYTQLGTALRNSASLLNLFGKLNLTTHHTKASKVRKLRRKIRAMGWADAALNTAAANPEGDDGTPESLDIQGPVSNFVSQFNTAFQRSPHGKPGYGSNISGFYAASSPCITGAPDTTLIPGVAHVSSGAISLNVTMSSFSLSLRVRATEAAALQVVVISPDGQSWDLSGSMHAFGPADSSGYVTLGCVDAHQIFSSPVGLDGGSWQVQTTFTPPGGDVPQDAILLSWALTFYH